MAPVEIVPIKPFSDGDSSHTPKNDWKLVSPATIYLEKLGSLWKESQQTTKPGVRYYLDKLPDGYRLYERPRPKNATHVDKHLYGHPSHKFFDSPNRFYPHFKHLMDNGSSDGCPCTLCNSTTKAPLPISRPKSAKSHFTPAKVQTVRYRDEEQMPDVVRTLLNKLKFSRELDEPVEERLSMDWRAEKDLLPQSIETLSKQKSWLPRIAEIVLFVRHLPPRSEICLDNTTQEFKVYQEQNGAGGFIGYPKWEAGVIGQVPNEAMKLQDVIQETSQSISISGYRVEPLPAPNSDDKSLTKQYKYVLLHHIRPFVFWREYTTGIHEDQLHPTIKNALTVMASVALVNRYRFKGTWPSATLFCRGIYVGSELLCVGDTVRLIPREGETVHSILQIEFIKLRFSNLDIATINGQDSGHPYNLTIAIAGKGYTASATHAWRATPTASPELAFPKVEGYEKWWWLHDPLKQLELPYTRVLGRCYEAEPMLLWFPSTSATDATSSLTHGLGGIQYGRLYSAKHDTRVAEDKNWFWADSRAEALDIPSLNRVDVSYFDASRDEDKLDDWHKAAKVLERTASDKDAKKLHEKVVEHKLAGAKHGLDTAKSALDGLGPAEDKPAGTAGVASATTPAGPSREDSSDSAAGEKVKLPEPSRRGTLLRRTTSTATTSRDELDQSRHPTGEDYSLEDWVKPVLQSTTPMKIKPSPSPAKLPSRPFTISPHKPPISPRKPATSASAAPARAQPNFSVTIEAKSKRARRAELESLSEEDERPPGNALAAFKKQKVIVLD